MKAILGVTGCIAAYKSAYLLRLLQDAGFEVQPVMTRQATRFIGPLTLEKLAGRRAVNDDAAGDSDRIEHIALARESDVLVVAPATANILAKFACGIADDFLSTLYISTVTPVVLAPAMNVEMWRHPATQANLKTLESRGATIVAPEPGYLACGEVGEGRLADPSRIVEAVQRILRPDSRLRGKRLLVSAGPTLEDIDAVRYISNRSSGKMGYALAREAARRGAQVTLVSGPTHLSAPTGVERVDVRSAAQMRGAVLQRYSACEIVVMSAAVSDFTPDIVHPGKVKKEEAELVLPLRRTQDILAELGRRKKDQFLVGFAAEFTDVAAYARKKLSSKNLDLIVANDISDSSIGFQSDSNQATLLFADGRERTSDKVSKDQLARLILDEIESSLERRSQPVET